MKPTMLFLDDQTKRIHAALERYRNDFDLTIVTNRLEFLRQLSKTDFDVVSMDHDLHGGDFTGDIPDSGSGILRYLVQTGWPENKPRPYLILHSTNVFAASFMKSIAEELSFPKIYIRPFECKERCTRKRGILAGSFDILHPGYMELFRDAKQNACDFLIVAVHEDPSITNPNKLPIVFTAEERMKTLRSIVYIDDVLRYRSEGDLFDLMKKEKPDVIIVGSDHVDGSITGRSLGIPIYYHQRQHNISETAIKEAICEIVTKGRKR